MLMDVGLDTGDILGFTFLNIEKLNAVELFEQLSLDASVLTIDTLKNFHSLKPMAQNASEASYSKKIKKENGLLDLLDAKSCDAKYRAFIFWPGVFMESGLKLKEISVEDAKGSNEIGKILSIDDDSIVLGCKVGSLKVTKVQPPSKKEMKVLDYIRGKRFGVGDSLS
jgi:methionyl-tRNA formyltransferase